MKWHERDLRQASWTRSLRTYLFERSGYPAASRVLEVGCGTGAVLGDLPASRAVVHGLDLDRASLAECREHAPEAVLTSGSVLALPYTGASFDITFCHYLLLWILDPLRALQEMKRVTTDSGYVIAFAEPDYGARIDRPHELIWLGQRQNEALERQGAALRRGGELATLFQRAGIRILETGTLRPSEPRTLTPEDWESEWQALQADVADLVPAVQLDRLRQLDRDAMRLGARVLAVPTYFVWGQV